jgi:ABC-type dipeptide/oligopeptide/nickel transport system permease component
LAQGAIIVLSAGFILINLTVDLLYGVLDPRVRHG